MTKRERRVLWIGGMVVTLGLGVRVAPSLWAAARSRPVTLAQTVALVARGEALLETAGALPDTLGARNARLVALAPRLLDGDTPAAVTASLSTLIDGWARLFGLTVSRLTPGADSLAGRFVRVEVRVQAEGDLEGFTRLVHAVETSPQLLSLTRFAVASEGTAEPVQRLRIEFAVQGWGLVQEGG